MTFRMDLPFTTKCGWPARLVGVLHRTAFPYVVAVWNPTFNAEELHCYNADGGQPVDTTNHSEMHPSAHEGALSLVNEDDDTYFSLKYDVLMNAHVFPKKSFPPGANVFHHDSLSMGIPFSRGWYIMYEGYFSDTQFPLRQFYLHHTATGQNIGVRLTPMRDAEIAAHKEAGNL